MYCTQVGDERNLLEYNHICKLARAMQCIGYLRNHAKRSFKSKGIMFSNISNSLTAAVAALFSAALFVGASVGPAVGNTASIIA